MRTVSKRIAAGCLAVATLAGVAVLTSTPASAQWCRWHRCGGWGWGGPFVGGLAAGAILGGVLAAPAPVYGPYAYPAYPAYPYPGYYHRRWCYWHPGACYW